MTSQERRDDTHRLVAAVVNASAKLRDAKAELAKANDTLAGAVLRKEIYEEDGLRNILVQALEGVYLVTVTYDLEELVNGDLCTVQTTRVVDDLRKPLYK